MDPFWEFCPPFVLCSSSWLTLGFTTGGGFVTVVDVHPTWRCTSPRAVVPVVLAVLQRRCLFTSFFNYSREETLLFSWEYGFLFLCTAGYASSMLLIMQVTKRQPTPGYNDAYSVGTPKCAFWVKSGQKHRNTLLSPLFRRVFWLTKGLCSFLGSW